ncbi:aldo/keto reductase [Streptomyces sp. XH2]|uniref:aldo/keto reductase n=1 Tax=Streptomyces sp. XH2 TaxID=3412483 RepID=UPI003C7D1AB2
MPPGERVPLGSGRTWITRLAFGPAGVGNLFTAVPDEEAAEAVGAAREAGIRSSDTAQHYGLGLSERRRGATLRGGRTAGPPSPRSSGGSWSLGVLLPAGSWPPASRCRPPTAGPGLQRRRRARAAAVSRRRPPPGDGPPAV